MELEVRGRLARAVLNADRFASLWRALCPIAASARRSFLRSCWRGAPPVCPVRRLVATMLGPIPLQTLDLDQVVALGAGVQAGLKMRDQGWTTWY